MSDFSETRTPNGGWQFYMPQTKFRLDRNSKPSSVSITLDQAAELVQKHRLQNPQFNLPTVFQQVRDEVIEFNRHRLGLPPADTVPKYIPQQPNRVVAVAEHISKTAAGIRLVVDWLGSGLKPVPRDEAELRAAVCATCPQNQTGDFWQRMDARAAEGVKRLIQIKTDMALMTSRDGELKTCLACDCLLSLKCHAPMQHILENTSELTRTKLDPRCWILKAAQQ